MKKGILTILLSVFMIMSTFTVGVFADGPDYFCITNTSSEDAIVTWTKYGNPDSINLKYKIGGGSWSDSSLDFTSGSATFDLPAGQSVYFKNDSNKFDNTAGYYTVACDKSHTVSGDITTLLKENGNVTDLTEAEIGIFRYLFQENNKLISAENLKLPSLILSENCYQYMFTGCEELVTAPELPATTLANSCYFRMFDHCKKLVTAPKLSAATTLAESCYDFMFSGCKSIATIPELPTSMKKINYFMFNDTGLTSIKLPDSITSIEDNAFSNCPNLTSVSIPKNVTSIANSAFYASENLNRVIINATAPPTLGEAVFDECSSDLKIYVPANAVDAYKTAWNAYNDKIVAVTIADILPNDFPTETANAWANDLTPIDTFVYKDATNNKLHFEQPSSTTTFDFALSEVLNQDNGNYFCSKDEKSVVFNMNDNNLVKIDFYGVERLKGTYTARKTIVDILPEDFPDDCPSGWVDKDGNRAYINNTNLIIGTSEFPLNTTLTREGDNYYIQPSIDKFVFVIQSGVLSRIDKMPLGPTVSYYPYQYTNEPFSKPEGYTGDLEFVTNATYIDPADANVSVKIDNETLDHKNYSVAHGSTKITLKGEYVKTLQVGPHTITILVDGYDPISQQFTITAVPSPKPKYTVPNTGVK